MNELPCLEDLVFIGNPLEEEMTANGKYTDEVIKRYYDHLPLDFFFNQQISEE